MTGLPEGDCITELAAMPEASVVCTGALCQILRRSPDSLARAITRGELPAPFRFMGRNAWTAGQIVRHLQQLQEAAVRERSETERRIAFMAP